jgi:hypothetical protein
MHRWLVVLLLYSGCAFGLSGPDSDRPRSKMPQCDTGKGLVVLDGVMATAAGLVALSLAGENEPAVALLPAGLGALYLGGAISGNRSVNKCRAAMTEYETYMASGSMRPPVDVPDEQPIAPPRRAPIATTQQAAAPVAAIAEPTQPAIAVPPQAPAASPPAVPKPAGKPAPAPKQQDQADWSEFWREVE